MQQSTVRARRWLRRRCPSIDSVAFASNAATLASGDANGKAYLWRITYHARNA